MTINLMISGLVFLMVQAVLFGIGAIVILETPLTAEAMSLMPWMIAASFVISVPLSLFLAPHLRARVERRAVVPGE